MICSSSSSHSVPAPEQRDGETQPPPPEVEAKQLPDADDATVRVGSTLTMQTLHIDETQLCVPSAFGTLLTSVVSSLFIFLGLVAMSCSHFFREASFTLFWRCIGWAFLFPIPVFVIASPMIRQYAIWGLCPGDSFHKDWPEALGDRCKIICKAFVAPGLLYLGWIAMHCFLLVIPIGEDHFGLVPVLLLGTAGNMLVFAALVHLLGPPLLDKGYARTIGPSVAVWPVLGSTTVVLTYFPLRDLGGVGMGVLMPFLLSTYELLGTLFVTRNFIKKFLTQREVREAYSGTNQGIIVSICICNIHAMAEGARLVMLWGTESKAQNEGSFTVLIPILSGTLWNVAMRVGCADRLLHMMTCGRWKANNTTKLLRDVGYCMGYPRFGALAAILLTRASTGQPLGNAFEARLLLVVFLSEVIEDFLSYILWYFDVSVYPEARFATDADVEKVSSGRRRSLTSVMPAWKAGSKEDSELRWQIRCEHDFKYGPTSFGQMPLWAHLLPACLAQFQTVFAMVIISNGFGMILNSCETSEHCLFLWPVNAT